MAGTQTAGTIPGTFPGFGVSPPRLSLPPSLGSFPPSSATDCLPDSGCSDRGRNPCPVSASGAEKGTGASSLGFSRKGPDCLRDGESWGCCQAKVTKQVFPLPASTLSRPQHKMHRSNMTQGNRLQGRGGVSEEPAVPDLHPHAFLRGRPDSPSCATWPGAGWCSGSGWSWWPSAPVAANQTEGLRCR